MAVTLVRTVSPTTHAGVPADELVGRSVRVRPYYSIPSGPTSLASARSPWVRQGHVTGLYGTEMVVVELYATEAAGPWKRSAAFYPRELHALACGCAACSGTGIHAPHGA